MLALVWLSGNPRVEFDTAPPAKFGLVLREIRADWMGVVWVAAAGFVTDGATIPRALWAMFGHPFSACLLRGAILHDYYYDLMAGTMQTAEGESQMRLFIDQLMLAAMLADGVPRWRAYGIYHGVRSFGWNAWRHHAKRNETGPLVELWPV
jgi:hypothetical protein